MNQFPVKGIKRHYLLIYPSKIGLGIPVKTVGKPGVLKKKPGFFWSVCLFGEEAEIPSDRFSIGSAQSRYSPQLVFASASHGE